VGDYVNYRNIFSPIADNAALHYGIPSSLFSRLIESTSGFDPHSPGGIAGLPQGVIDTGVDPNNPGKSINAAAAYMSRAYGTGTWRDAVASYIGIETTDEKVSSVVGNFDPAQMEPAPAPDPNAFPVSVESIWKWGVADWKNFFLSYTVGIVFFSVGFLLIVFALYAMVMKSNKSVTSLIVNTAKGN
jgi:hypothetical protein